MKCSSLHKVSEFAHKIPIVSAKGLTLYKSTEQGQNSTREDRMGYSKISYDELTIKLMPRVP